MTDDQPPEPDRIEGARHPRDTDKLFGQGAAEAGFLAASASGRLHHAWLITGPRGVGKATLAWRIARFLLTEPAPDEGLFDGSPPPASLDTNREHPVIRRMLAGAEPRLFVLRRAWDDKAKRLRKAITVDETRRLKSFFGLSAADGGRRVVIVDAADEMNISAANAFLKVLEEPPDDAVLLLVSHQPARLLRTIRSRCRELRCASIEPDDMALALSQLGIDEEATAGPLTALSGGSVGAAMSMASEDGAALYAKILSLLDAAPGIDRSAAIALANDAGQRGQTARRDLILDFLDLLLARLARTGAGAPPDMEAASGERAVLIRLAPDGRAGRRWAELQQSLSDRARRGIAVNLDPVSVILDMILKINETAAATIARH